MKLKQAFLGGAALFFASTGADAAVIKLTDSGGVTGSQAERGFKIAALYWQSVLTNDVTINLDVGYRSMDGIALGETGSNFGNYSVANWERQIGLTRSTSALDQAAILPTLNAQGGATFITNGTAADGNDDTRVLTLVTGNTVGSRMLSTNTSVLKAIGAIDANAKARDGDVTFNSRYAFDFDPSDGIDAGAFDFIGVAIHEIGHALGFVSGVDWLDVYGYPNGIGAGTLGYALNDTPNFTALDMFRYSSDPAELVSGDGPVLDLSVGTESYFSIDGGKTQLFGDSRFSTGNFNGDGAYASHWRDTGGEQRCTGQLGIMDPTICPGQTAQVTALDLAAFDAMGWNTTVDVLKNSAYRATTAGIYRQFLSAVPEPATWAMMLTGFAMVGGALRGRRARAETRVGFMA